MEMFKGTILTDKNLRTNVEDVYAIGDCAMVTNRETGEPAWSPMGSTANIAGRVLAKNLCGGEIEYAGVLGTGVAKLPGGINTGRTGLTETAAKAAMLFLLWTIIWQRLPISDISVNMLLKTVCPERAADGMGKTAKVLKFVCREERLLRK